MSRVRRQAVATCTADASVLSIIEELTTALRFAGLPDPRRVSTDILAGLLDVPRSWPTMNRETEVDGQIIKAAREAARRLAAGAPFAYAVGSSQFRYLNLTVDSRVLIPRPETEVLVGEVLERMDARFKSGEQWGIAVDIGTGSGAIALSLASEGRFEKVIASDVSQDALDVAQSNATRSAAALRCEVEFRRGSFLSPVRDVKATVLVSNPPYIAFSELDTLPRSVRDWEPPLALISGYDGMAATARIIAEGARILTHGGILALEVAETRASLVAELMMRQSEYTDVGLRLDLTGRERFVFASRT